MLLITLGPGSMRSAVEWFDQQNSHKESPGRLQNLEKIKI